MSNNFINMLKKIGRVNVAPNGNAVLVFDSIRNTNIDFSNIAKIYGYKADFMNSSVDDLRIIFKPIQSGVSNPIQSAKEIVAQVSNGVHEISHHFNRNNLTAVSITLDTNLKYNDIYNLTKPYGFALWEARFNPHLNVTRCIFKWEDQ